MCRKRKNAVWQRMDEELLPEVRALTASLYEEGGERPQRITVSLIQRKLGLPDKRFDKLPLCRAEILRYRETQTEYWAREAVWAYRKLRLESAEISWRRIRELTNMRKQDFLACQGYLKKYASVEEAEQMQGLL